MNPHTASILWMKKSEGPAQAVTPLFCIRKALSSNFGQETDHPEAFRRQKHVVVS
jgi:hypothetical protein